MSTLGGLEIGPKIRLARLAKGMSKAKLARIVGMNPNTLNAWERGAYKISTGKYSHRENLRRIGRALQLNEFVEMAGEEDEQWAKFIPGPYTQVIHLVDVIGIKKAEEILFAEVARLHKRTSELLSKARYSEETTP